MQQKISCQAEVQKLDERTLPYDGLCGGDLISAPRLNLIITRAGSASLHRTWITKGVEPTFDMVVAAYHPGAIDADTETITHVYIPGAKVVGWAKLLNDRPDFFVKYDRVALLDDDIETCTAVLNKCFEMGKQHRLAIWQPGLTGDSYATYAASLANGKLRLRFVNVVEMMCPFFSIDTLNAVRPLFSLGFESGIDLVWCSIAHERGGITAVVDNCAVKHTRPVGSLKASNGFVTRDYESDIYAILNMFSMRWPSWVAFTAITESGVISSCRLRMALFSLMPLLSIREAPHGERLKRALIALQHFRHQVTRQVYFKDHVVSALGTKPGDLQ